MRLVMVVTSTLSSFFTRLSISPIRSSIWFSVTRTSSGGSTSPVGRISCSTITPSLFISS